MLSLKVGCTIFIIKRPIAMVYCRIKYQTIWAACLIIVATFITLAETWFTRSFSFIWPIVRNGSARTELVTCIRFRRSWNRIRFRRSWKMTSRIIVFYLHFKGNCCIRILFLFIHLFTKTTKFIILFCRIDLNIHCCFNVISISVVG